MSYLCDLFFHFHRHFHYNQYNLIKTDKLVCWTFQISIGQKWMKKMNHFQIAKFQPRDVAQLLLDFLTISACCCL